MKYIFCDTSALMQSPEGVNNLLKKEEATALVCSVVLDELDKHKDGSDTERKYKARQAIKLLNKLEEEDRVIIAVKEDAILPNNFDMRVPDNKILACLKAMKDVLKTVDIKLLTYDNGMKIKAKLLGMPTIIIDDEEEETYKGYVDIYGNEEEVYAQICDFEDHKTLRQNQYVIVHQRENENEEYDVYALRYNGKELVDTIEPKKSKCPVKPLNGPQQCALDLMYNQDIPVKIICGGYGSGKTFIAVKSAEDMVEYRGVYNKLMLVRNPVPADDIDIGALPGSKHDKVGSYFKSMTQYLKDYSNGIDVDSFDPTNEMAAKQRGYELIMEIPSFMKGMSVEETIMIVDECEDLSLKQVKMLGTRIGKDSCIVFTGDYHQAEKKYKADSGISKMIEQFKGDPLVGIVVLEEDVRSSTSKLFANLDN